MFTPEDLRIIKGLILLVFTILVNMIGILFFVDKKYVFNYFSLEKLPVQMNTYQMKDEED